MHDFIDLASSGLFRVIFFYDKIGIIIYLSFIYSLVFTVKAVSFYVLVDYRYRTVPVSRTKFVKNLIKCFVPA